MKSRMKIKHFLRTELFLFFLFLLSTLAPVIFVNVQAEQRLQRAVENARNHHVELDIKQFVPLEIPPEENASNVIEDAIAATISTNDRLLSPQDGYANKIKEIFYNVGPFGIVSSEDIQVLKDAIQPYASGLAILSASSYLQNARFETDYSKSDPNSIVSPNMEIRNQLMDILRAKALVAMQDGEDKTAYESIRLALRFSGWVHLEFPFLGAAFNSMRFAEGACETMHQLMWMHPPDVSEWQAIQSEIDASKKRIAETDFLRIECAWDSTSNRALLSAENKVLYNPIFLRPITNPYIKANHAVSIDFLVDRIDKYNYPFYQIREAIQVDIQNKGSIPLWSFLGRIVAQSILPTIAVRSSCLSVLKQTEIAMDLIRYKQKNDKFPDQLDSLSDLSQESMQDLYTGNLYFYRADSDRFILYSAGPDGDDDGGIMNSLYYSGWYDGDLVWDMPDKRQ
jgi:hypothetical protein